MWMNQSEIEWAASRHHDCPNVRKGVKLLLRLVEAVNEQSDGWAYWHAPDKAAEKLMDLLRTTGNLQHGSHGTLTDAQLKAAISPIRRMVAIGLACVDWELLGPWVMNRLEVWNKTKA